MTRFASWRVGAVVLSAGLLLAGCGGGGGGPATVDTNAVGAGHGNAGGSSAAHGSKSPGAGGKSSGVHKPGQGGSTSAARSSSSANSGGGGSGDSGGGNSGGGGGSTGGGGGGSGGGSGGGGGGIPSGCVQSTSAGAHIVACPGHDLHDGDFVTISGDHFKPNEGLVAAECHYKGEDANNYGLSDCHINNILNFGPGKTVKSDASGNVAPVQIPVALKYKRVDCSTEQCMVTVFVPIQSSTADNPHALIYFS